MNKSRINSWIPWVSGSWQAKNIQKSVCPSVFYLTVTLPELDSYPNTQSWIYTLYNIHTIHCTVIHTIHCTVIHTIQCILIHTIHCTVIHTIHCTTKYTLYTLFTALHTIRHPIYYTLQYTLYIVQHIS